MTLCVRDLANRKLIKKGVIYHQQRPKTARQKPRQPDRRTDEWTNTQCSLVAIIHHFHPYGDHKMSHNAHKVIKHSYVLTVILTAVGTFKLSMLQRQRLLYLLSPLFSRIFPHGK